MSRATGSNRRCAEQKEVGCLVRFVQGVSRIGGVSLIEQSL